MRRIIIGIKEHVPIITNLSWPDQHDNNFYNFNFLFNGYATKYTICILIAYYQKLKFKCLYKCQKYKIKQFIYFNRISKLKYFSCLTDIFINGINLNLKLV